MNARSITALIFAVIVFVEIMIFINAPTPTVTVKTGTTLFGSTQSVTDYKAQSDSNVKYAVVIGSTILIGAIITFSLPSSSTKNTKNIGE